MTESPPRSIPQRTDRIAVIGSGIAGCSAARRLRQLGYGDVTVFEAESRAGGKMYTRMLDGLPFEMGAVCQTAGNPRLRGLIEEFGLQSKGMPCPTQFDIGTKRPVRIAASRRLLGQIWRFRAFLKANQRRLAQPEEWHVAPALCEPFTSWAQANGFDLIPDMLMPIVTSFGYGPLGDIPAAYVLKYVDYRNFDAFVLTGLWEAFVPRRLGLRCPSPLITRLGVTKIIEGLARGLDLRLGTAVTAIAARPRPVLTVATQGTTEEIRFDRVVFATVPTDIDGLDAVLSPELLQAFRAIRVRHYTTVLCRADGLDVSMYFPVFENGVVVDPTPTRSCLFVRHFAESNGCVFYHLGDEPTSDEAIEAAIRATLGDLGGTLHEVVEIRRWRYFPHFGGIDLSGDPHALLRREQGGKGLYFVGSYLTVETMEHSLGATLDVIDRHFGSADVDVAETSGRTREEVSA